MEGDNLKRKMNATKSVQIHLVVLKMSVFNFLVAPIHEVLISSTPLKSVLRMDVVMSLMTAHKRVCALLDLATTEILVVKMNATKSVQIPLIALTMCVLNLPDHREVPTKR
jgi:hypothetical protein